MIYGFVVGVAARNNSGNSGSSRSGTAPRKKNDEGKCHYEYIGADRTNTASGMGGNSDGPQVQYLA